MKAQFNNSSPNHAYDGDYSYLYKEELDTASADNFENLLAWLKRDGYKKQTSRPDKCEVRKNLMWLKIKGYQSKNSSVSLLEQKSRMYATEPLHAPVYHRIQIDRARARFYFESAIMLIILNLIFFLEFINH